MARLSALRRRAEPRSDCCLVLNPGVQAGATRWTRLELRKYHRDVITHARLKQLDCKPRLNSVCDGLGLHEQESVILRWRRLFPCSAAEGTFNRQRGSRISRTAMGVRVVVGDGEPIDTALQRLKQRVEREGVAWEVRRRAYCATGTELRRAKRFQKRFKAREAALLARMAAGLSCPALEAAKAAFWRRTGKP